MREEAQGQDSSPNVLVQYVLSLLWIVESDTSQYGVGAVILHRSPDADE